MGAISANVLGLDGAEDLKTRQVRRTLSSPLLFFAAGYIFRDEHERARDAKLLLHMGGACMT